jgi:hypothetical protein
MQAPYSQWTETQRQRHRELKRLRYKDHPEIAREWRERWKAKPGSRAQIREYDRTRRTDRRALLQLYKQIMGCADCGDHFEGRPECLAFDHKPGTEKYLELGQMLGQSLAVIIAEVEKCEVVCHNCHATRTRARRSDT